MIYDLKRVKIRSIIHHDESECLGITDAADPSADLDFPVIIGFPVFVYLSYGRQIHMKNLLFLCLECVLAIISHIKTIILYFAGGFKVFPVFAEEIKKAESPLCKICKILTTSPENVGKCTKKPNNNS